MGENSKQAVVRDKKNGIFARIFLFLRQVIDELKKVVYPTRDELQTYFMVVIVFLLIVMGFVAIVDLLSSSIAHLLFGA